ncbi:MAG: fumarylacetoacetate hydrolase family protein [Acidobacteriota bacterium]|nr:fumarylacetoacetate hydrolase family protein [Acidobacteriota bacterium]
MKLVTFRRGNGAPEVGVVVEQNVIALSGAGITDMIAVLGGGRQVMAQVENWVYQPPVESIVPISSVTLTAPLPRPPKLICVGLNYRDHAIESKMEIPKVPTIFSKFPSCVIGPGDAVVLPRNSTRPDYEAEFAFVIGKGGRHIPAGHWREHVFGYTLINDISARDFQMATTQWLMGKTFDTFAPMGPWLVTADEIADPHALDISMEIGGEILQKSNTRELIFKIPELIEYLSSVVTLEPGDVVSTGTPAGVGSARTPPRYLKAGDQMVVRVEGIGELRNPVVAETPAS